MQSREYIQKNPIRSTISATGYGVVNTVELVVDSIDVARDVVRLTKHTLAESLIEAETESLKAQLKGNAEIAELKAQLAMQNA